MRGLSIAGTAGRRLRTNAALPVRFRVRPPLPPKTPMVYTWCMKETQQSWLLEMWNIKVNKWREAVRVYARSGAALLRAFISPALEMRGLERRLAVRRGACEEEVLRRSGKWFAVLDKAGLRPSCLVRSLTLARVLREEGHDAHLVFGVRSGNGDVEGHCWVAVDGRPLTEAPRSFKELKNG